MDARVTMEEKYATLSVIYGSLEEKELIFKTNEMCVRKYNLSPDIYFKPDKPGEGRVIVEFRENTRDVQAYFECFISESKIKIKEV